MPLHDVCHLKAALMRPRHILSAGFGVHSRKESMTLYSGKLTLFDGAVIQPNIDLELSKAQHFVLGYQLLFSDVMHLKADAYYQDMYDIPAHPFPPYFSSINFDYGFEGNVMTNYGTAFNRGIELTLEKFLSSGYYVLFTTSLFDSKYVGGDGVTRNTAFNGNYVFNLLGGYERRIAEATFLTVDLKGVLAGGRRYVPIDVDESMAQGSEVREWSRAYEDKYDDYFRIDLRFGIKLDHKRFSQEWALDLQNLTGHQNLFAEGIDVETGEIYQVYQQGFLPMFLYRIQF